MRPKLVITDIDGVWTDGGMYYDNTTGNEWKKFNTSDSAGVLFCRLLEIPVAIVTGEDTEIVRRRGEKLGISELHMGVKNKLNVAIDLCKKYQIELTDVAFIGDDINDIPLLRVAGYSACPASAKNYVQSEANYITKLRGGEGAFREFVEYILSENGLLQVALTKYLDSIKD